MREKLQHLGGHTECCNWIESDFAGTSATQQENNNDRARKLMQRKAGQTPKARG
jgi:hypothetical protein